MLVVILVRQQSYSRNGVLRMSWYMSLNINKPNTSVRQCVKWG